MNNTFSIFSIRKIKRVGAGQSNTLIINNKYVIKIKNSIREKESFKIYNNKYSNSINYFLTDKFEYEFKTLEYLYNNGLSPKPLEYNSRYLIINYIDAQPIFLEEIINIDNLLNAIENLHNKNIYHTDLNLGNILINKDGCIFFIDFEYKFRDDLSNIDKTILVYAIFLYKMYRFFPNLWSSYRRVLIEKIKKIDGNILEYIIKSNEFSMEFRNEIRIII